MWSTTISNPPLPGWVLPDGSKILEVFDGDVNALHQVYMGIAKVESPTGEVRIVRADWWVSPDGSLFIEL
jgi:hypothetical protein